MSDCDDQEVKRFQKRKAKAFILKTKLTNNMEDRSGSRLLVAREKLAETLKGGILPDQVKWKTKVTDMRILGQKEGCRNSRGRQMLNGGVVTSASCHLHKRMQRRPVTCFESTLQLFSTHRSQKQLQNSLQSNSESQVVKTCDSLPIIKCGTEQSPSQTLRTKPITMSKLHKMITESNSQGEVLKEKNRVRISIKRIDPTDNATHPKTPKVKVMILKQQKSQSPVSPKKIIGNKIEDENLKESGQDSETNFLFDEWKFIPDFNQKDFLRQLDPQDLRSLQRTRTWLLSIPLDATNDDDM